MTQSIRGATKRQDREGSEGSALDYEPMPDVAQNALPIAGLALPGPLAVPGPLGPARIAAAGPISVVDALRRQAIRRSSMAVTMDLGNDHDSEMEEEEEEDEEREQASWEGTAEEAGQNVVAWLRKKAGGGTNYTVAVYNDDIYITKVGGVTKATKLIKELKTHIETEGIENGRDIYLCQTYNSSQPSNHAEMCVLAAIGEANLGSITFLECTSPSCDYCAATLTHYGVPNTSPDGEPASQAGWTHPFQKVAFGTQLGDHRTQVAELKAYLADTGAKLTVGKTIGTPPSGRCEKWL